MCLYRRNQRLAHSGSRCLYSKYLLNKTVSLHKNVKHLLTLEQYSLLPSLTNFGCPFKKASTSSRAEPTIHRQNRSIEDEFIDFKHFVDPGYQKFERFDRHGKFASSSNVYNVSNDGKNEVNTQKPQENSLPKKDLTQDEAIDEAIQQLAKIVGEYEFQLGLESVLAGHFEDAADHFKLSTNHNHPGGIFNLAICYEQGVGVKKSMTTARKLYEIASRFGHAKALYNLGVFSSQGLGGANKDSQQAKQYFEQAANLGNIEASEALKVFLPIPKKFTKIVEFPVDDLFFTEKLLSSAIATNQNQLMRRIAVS